MTPLVLLDRLQDFVSASVKDIVLPTAIRAGSTEPKEGVAGVYKMHLPEKKHEIERAPYIILRYLGGTINQPAGSLTHNDGKVRMIFCTYGEKMDDGLLSLLGLMERVILDLSETRIIGNQFLLIGAMEHIIYQDLTAPYYLGEIMTNWELPPMERMITFV